MRTYNSRVISYNAVTVKCCRYAKSVSDNIMDGGNTLMFDLSPIIWQYLTDSISVPMANEVLADKELDYLIKNV